MGAELDGLAAALGTMAHRRVMLLCPSPPAGQAVWICCPLHTHLAHILEPPSKTRHSTFFTQSSPLESAQPLSAGASSSGPVLAPRLANAAGEASGPWHRVAGRQLPAAARSLRAPFWSSLPELLINLLDQHGLSRADLGLAPRPGTASRVREHLNGKRELSMSMIRKIRERLHVPADLLIPREHPRGMAA